MATHSSVLAWTIPGAEEPGGLPSLGSHRVGHDWSDLAAAAAACGPGTGLTISLLRLMWWTPSLCPQSCHFLGALEWLNGFIFLALLVPVVTVITFLLFWQPEDFDVKPTFLKPDERHTDWAVTWCQGTVYSGWHFACSPVTFLVPPANIFRIT